MGVETQALVPSYGRWLETCDMSPAYEQHRIALQVLQSGQPTERWVLKSPNHLWCLKALLATYPDARIIWTHRDPGHVVTSLASLVNALQRTFTHRRDPQPVAEEWNHKARHALSRGMAFDDANQTGWCCHVQYRDLVADPIETVRRIYARFGEDVGHLHRRRMEVWMRERPRPMMPIPSMLCAHAAEANRASPPTIIHRGVRIPVASVPGSWASRPLSGTSLPPGIRRAAARVGRGAPSAAETES